MAFFNQDLLGFEAVQQFINVFCIALCSQKLPGRNIQKGDSGNMLVKTDAGQEIILLCLPGHFHYRICPG